MRRILKKLEKIKDQVVSLNMQSMPLKQEDIAIITGFKQLEKLNLNYTGLTIEALKPIKSLTKLKVLSIAGIEANTNGIINLVKGSTIQELNIWNVSIKADQIQSIQASKKDLIVIIDVDNVNNDKSY